MSKPIVPQKGVHAVDAEGRLSRPLYELLRSLGQQSVQTATAVAAVGRGEAPDGSGVPLIDTTKFFFLPGRDIGQIASGSTAPGGNLTLSSTANADKGFIYLGSPTHRAALDEDQGFLGVGTDTPAARLHLATTALGTAVVGATGTPFARFTYASTDKLDIAPLLNDGGVVDIALNVSTGSIQFIDSSIGAAGFRVAFSATRTFLQAGRINSSSIVQNRNLTLGGMNATIGNTMSTLFQTVTLTTAVGTNQAGSAIAANDAIIAVNLTADDYLTSLAASKFSLIVGPRSAVSTCAPLIAEQSSTTVNGFEYRHSSTGVSPSKVLGYRKIAIGPTLGAGTEGAVIGYTGDVESFRLTPQSSGVNLQWAFLSPAGLQQVGHAVLTTAWSDSLTGNSTRIELGDVANSVRAAALISTGGNRFNRFGICTIDGVTIENTFYSGGASALSAPLAMLYLVNNATNGADAKVLLQVQSKRAGQTGKFVDVVNSIGTSLFQVLSSGRVGVSITPTAMLHLPAGTITASTAPLKFTTGTSMTAAEAGAVEFTTDDLFFTITTGTARKRILFADAVGGLVSGQVPFVTTNGRLTGTIGLTYATTTGLSLTPPAGTSPVLKSTYTDTVYPLAGTGAISTGIWTLAPTLSNVATALGGFVVGLGIKPTYSDLFDATALGIGLALTGSLYSLGGSVSTVLIGSYFSTKTTGTAGAGSAWSDVSSIRSLITHASGDPVDFMSGVKMSLTLSANAGAVTTLQGFELNAVSIGANVTVTTFRGLSIPNPTGLGTITTAIGISIENITKGSTNYAIDSAGGQSRHVGNFFIGAATDPTAKLHLAAGATGASTAPIKLTSGTSMTAAEAGAVEFTTDDLFFTITTGTARLRLVLADPTGGLTSGRVPFATTNGRLTDDADLTFATDTLTATKLVGTTSVKVGTAAGYISSDGSTGATGSFTTTDLKTVTVKDGIITSIV